MTHARRALAERSPMRAAASAPALRAPLSEIVRAAAISTCVVTPVVTYALAALPLVPSSRLALLSSVILVALASSAAWTLVRARRARRAWEARHPAFRITATRDLAPGALVLLEGQRHCLRIDGRADSRTINVSGITIDAGRQVWTRDRDVR